MIWYLVISAVTILETVALWVIAYRFGVKAGLGITKTEEKAVITSVFSPVRTKPSKEEKSKEQKETEELMRNIDAFGERLNG